jgi:hypothetical protein
MIVSVHIAQTGPLGVPRALRRRPDPAETPGLLYAEPTLTAPMSSSARPSANLRTAALISAWEDDDSLDRFLERPESAPFSDGWHVRMEPLRVSGSWPQMPGLPTSEKPVDRDEPVAVLTLGWLRLNRLVPFLRAANRAEADAVEEPDMLASLGLARPPHFVSTFSLWRSAAAMRDYAYRQRGAHRAAVATDRERAFHHRSAFIRFRPYLSQGTWEGRDPLRGLLRPVPA